MIAPSCIPMAAVELPSGVLVLMRDNSRSPGRGRQTDKKSTRVEMKCADQTRIANGYLNHPMLAPIVGQCFLPTHTWRNSDLIDKLNAATFNCQAPILRLPRDVSTVKSASSRARLA